MDLIKELHQYLREDIQQVNEVIISSISSSDEELISLISNHLVKTGGKRIRPILTILVAKMFSYKGDKSIKLAAAIEFIHMATLLHDDVVDGSKMRRFLPSANIVWGNKASILVGDFLFSQSFKLIVSTESLPALKVLSKASAVIAEGEVSQLAKLEEQRIITKEEYLKIINSKTAELFSAACEVGAIIAGQDYNYCNLLQGFGKLLGNIFQITDDVLDYFGSSTLAGKNIGEDFKEGKVTLPLIYLFKKLNSEEKKYLKNSLKEPIKPEECYSWAKEEMIKHDIKTEIYNYLDGLKKQAISYLEQISISSKDKDYLRSLVDFAISRSY